MMIRKKSWGGALLLVGLFAACSPEVRELGDGPVAGEAGAGGSGGDAIAGSGTIVPGGASGSGGTPVAGGSGGAGDGGAAPEPECFSPSSNLKLAQQEGAIGCPCVGSGEVCVSDFQSDPVWIGMLICEDGRWRSVPPTCDMGCFAPNEAPALAIDHPDAGCACNGDEPAECVLTEYQGQPWRVALYCEAGRWISAEDGVCGDGRQSDCRVDGVTYPHGGRGVPDPFGCGTCTCDNGSLKACSDADCVPSDCPSGSFASRRCLDCGPVDQCTLTEIGCLSGDGCDAGLCVGALCG
jgi:hypothetical protein